MAMIEVERLAKTYALGDAPVHALRGVDLSVAEGEMIAIMGPSGSGKSTLMAILGCLDSPSEGAYRLAGRDVSRLSDRELAIVRRERIGFVFQHFNLLPRATALENTELPLLYAGATRRAERARRALEAVGLGDRTHHRPAQMSGGEQQRVAIARALVNEPAVILADEPTGNLDSRTGEQVLDMLRGLHRQHGLTLVVVTHDRHVAEQAQRIVHLKDGLVERVEVVAHASGTRGKPDSGGGYSA